MMEGFQQMAYLPYLVGAMEGTHTPRPGCSGEQYYNYKYYIVFTSIVEFAMIGANWRYINTDVGLPGVLDDNTIISRSDLRKLSYIIQLIGPGIPSMEIREIGV